MLKKLAFSVNTVVKTITRKSLSMKEVNKVIVNGFTAPGFEKVYETFR